MYCHKVDSATSNIPTTYDTTAGSLMFTAPSAGQLEILNRTTSVLAMTFVGNASVPESVFTTNRSQLFIPPAASGSTSGWVKDRIKINSGDKVYLRSDSGSAVTSGVVYFNIW